jgi:predicted transcriptional regulator of viral defense system
MSRIKFDNKIFSAKQALAAGLSYMCLSRLVDAGKYERITRGIYQTISQYDDMLYAEQLRRPKIVYSHETALCLHELSDRNSRFFSVTVPAGYNTKALLNEKFKVFSLKKELYEGEIIQIKTKYGFFVNVYSLERTLVDILRSRSRIDPEIVSIAFQRYSRTPYKNIFLLMEIAKRFGVLNILWSYLEVLI